jgi:dTDP-4-dehydrorhamnose 3,5-epimerase
MNSQIIGVTYTEARQILSEKGAVLHLLRNDSPQFVKFGECYMSELFPKAIKAWKMHKMQTQNLTVPVGRIKLVLFDVRQDSETKNNFIELELGRPDSYYLVTIPPGVWYGFQSISNSNSLIVNCSDMPHDKEESVVMDITNSLIPYKWDF